MSVPVMNSVVPAAVPAAPSTITPLSLTVSPVKTSPPPPVAAKPEVNHNTPISLVQDNKPKITEKPKENPVEPTKPTSNGVDVTTGSKPDTPSDSASAVVLPPASTAEHVTAEVPTAATAPETPPAVVALAATPPPVSEAPLATASDSPAVNQKPEPIANSEPSPVATSEECPSVSDLPKQKAPKPQATKRRREAEATTEGMAPVKNPRRTRAPVSPYQSPLPEITTVIKHSLREKRQSKDKPSDEKLIVFYKFEFLAVRNAEGSFYLCQTLQNIYKTSHKIRIRWLSPDDKESSSEGGIYAADFYDTTDVECILTSVSLQKKGKNKFKMPAIELERVESILKRALDVEKGVSEKPNLTEEHPDGLDLSLYKNESQLKQDKKQAKKRKSSPSQKKTAKKIVAPAKKAKVAAVSSKKKVVASPTYAPSTSKAKLVPRKAFRRTSPTPPKAVSSRTERSSARDKVSASTSAKVSTAKPATKKPTAKPAKVDKQPVKAKSSKGKQPVKSEKPAPLLKSDKKPEKGKGTPPAPAVASTSKRNEKAKKSSQSAGSDKRATRKRTRK